MKATEQYVPVVRFGLLCKVILSVESVDEILNEDHSNKIKLLSSTLLCCCLSCYRLDGSNFLDWDHSNESC